VRTLYPLGLMIKTVALATVVLVSGCGIRDFYQGSQIGDGVTADEHGKHLMSQATTSIYVGSGASMRERAEKQAREHCAKQGKTYKHVSDIALEDAVWPARPGRALIEFQCLPG
jgi:hypothetical protein